MTERTSPANRKPRVIGSREDEILEATLRVLGRVGYDRLTMDVVARESKASKATLYRHWKGKADIVVDAVSRAKGMPLDVSIDKGSLAGDLESMWSAKHGWGSGLPMLVAHRLMSAQHTDPDLSTVFRERFLRPRLRRFRAIFDRARTRGEITTDIDTETLMMLLPAMVIQRELVLGEPVDDAYIHHLVENVVLPIAGGCHAPAKAQTRRQA